MAATRINKGGCHFDVASGPFKWPGGALTWPHGTLKIPIRTLKNIKNKRANN